ncbi:probable multidrug resistance-associated protein lethal(2)03659 isoform X1 [Leptinotarsa decemlineata]|uniref:probable multidrug resistance-associated protein lethal(2)03659 isoform X1 n=2 Tax=Leptinotarsa decemlineata TaxID=7539 RepID=UPI003D30A3D1
MSGRISDGIMEEVKADETYKKKNPYDRANFISKLFFLFLLPYFVKGYKRELTEDDMYSHRHKHDSGKLGERLEAAWQYQVKHKKNPSFIKALCSVFLSEIFMLWIIAFAAEIIRLSQPLLISKLLTLYDENQVAENQKYLYIYSGLIVLSLFITVFLTHAFFHHIMQVGMKLRIACCSLVYRKALRLNKSALAETTIGQMVNLLSNDVGRFDQATHFMHHLIMGPVEILVVMILCYFNVGYTGLIGAVFLLVSVPFQSWLGKKTSKYRLNTALRTDERVRLMNEIISGIQVIKMYAWEKSFAKLVELARMKEMKFIRLTSTIKAILMSCAMVLDKGAIFWCILVYVLTGNPLNSAYVFTMTSFYRLLNTITMFFPQAVSQVSEMFISIKRVRTFLMYDELDFGTVNLPKSIKNGVSKNEHTTGKKDVGIQLYKASAKWLKFLPENNLEDISLDVTSGDLVAVVGSVGSGKTTLLNMVLGELVPQAGTVKVKGTVSYASQEPWLFGGSVRQNILFGQEFDQRKYDEVVRVCALERDFKLFPHGDRTLAGERGVTLSGGQRARINLARAVYKEADIYLLDDPLSAVDTHVGKQLFDECICEYLKEKCVILVTHQLQYLKNVNNIYLLEYGKVLVSGSYEEIRTSDTKFSRMLADLEEEEEEIRRKSMILAEKQEEQLLDDDDQIQILQREEKGVGGISWHVYKSYMRAGGNILKVFLLCSVFLLSQVFESGTEYFVTFWVNTLQWLSYRNTTTNEVKLIESQNITGETTNPLDSYEDWWLTPIFTSDNTIIYYSVLILLLVVTVFTRCLSFYRWCLTASTRLHNQMFDNIVYSPMRFFTINPSGRILNRFSKDIGALDETLPMTLLDTMQIALYVAGICFVIGSLSVWIMVPTFLIGILFYFLRVIFLKTSRDVKRVESVTRSPIYTHLSASLQGLTTIRAFKAQEILKKEFDKYQNLNSAAFYMYLAATRTFGFWLDLNCVVYISSVLIVLLFVKSETFGGNMGLALTQAMDLTGMFQWGMRQWSEMENQMTSVERVQEYADLKPEKQEDTVKEPPKFWPETGMIEFRDMSLRYSPDDPCVLNNLNFIIKATEKVGIVGRTGAGKSSLIQALFRLASIEGSILIDDVDTRTVELKKLRSKISIIPQEPVLFSGTLRNNLDPFNEFSDELLWNALDEVELKIAVADLPSGLDSKMAEGGTNFSVGQRQLVCLARAILRDNKILVLDEATANVDPHTDSLIQETIRKKFANCTVLTIAHRLHTIMDSDKVLVMDAGRKAEFDHPHLLLQNETGVFYSLVMQTGKATAKNLMAIAEETYEATHSQLVESS